MSTSTNETRRKAIIQRGGIRACVASAALIVAIASGTGSAAADVKDQCELVQLVRLFQNADPGGAAQFRLREEIDQVVYR